jgi:hypothetical protein
VHQVGDQPRQNYDLLWDILNYSNQCTVTDNSENSVQTIVKGGGGDARSTTKKARCFQGEVGLFEAYHSSFSFGCHDTESNAIQLQD